MHQFVKASARINFAKEWHWFKSENKINSDGWAGGLSWCYSGALQPQPVYLIYDATLRHRGVSVLWAIKARIQKYDARLPNWPDMCQNKDVWTKLGQKSGIYWGSQEWEETPELALHSGMEISSLVNCVLVVVLLTPLLHNFMCLLSTLRLYCTDTLSRESSFRVSAVSSVLCAVARCHGIAWLLFIWWSVHLTLTDSH